MRKSILLLLSILSFSTLSAQNGVQLGGFISNGAANQVDIAVDNGTIYVAYTEESEERHIHLKKFSSGAWSEVGLMPEDAKSGSGLSLKIHNGIPYILYAGYTGMTLAKFEGGKWFQVGKPEFAADISAYDPQFLFRDEKVYIVYENKTDDIIDMHLYERVGDLGFWTDIDALDEIPGGSEQPAIALLPVGGLYLAWFNRKKESLSVARISADESKLESISKGIPGKDVSNFLGLKAIGNSIFLAYEDKANGYAVQIMEYVNSKDRWLPLGDGSNLESEGFRLNENKSGTFLNVEKQVAISLFENGNWGDAEIVSPANTEFFSSCSDANGTYIAFPDASKGNKIVVKKIN